jgi:hypothetical protein
MESHDVPTEFGEKAVPEGCGDEECDCHEWKCKYCNAISYNDSISDKDGICLHHPAGVGNHTFRKVTI